MKRFASEFRSDYSSYSFGYCNYAEMEAPEELGQIYDLGYLPYSGNPRLQRDLFYMARSVRVRVPQFSFTKKRRYLQRRLETDLHVRFQVFEKAAFLAEKEDVFRECAFQWLEQRFEQAYLNNERLDYILGKAFLNTVLELSIDEKPAGYALLCRWDNGLHFWYSFYDSVNFGEYSLGKWLMGRSLEWAREQALTFAYLGTAYREKSDYKMHGTNGIEFFDGQDWIADREQLRALLAADELPPADSGDAFKRATRS